MNEINCPLCKKRKLLIPKYTPRQRGIGMARLYWYCWDCKLSMTKSVRKHEESNYEDDVKMDETIKCVAGEKIEPNDVCYFNPADGKIYKATIGVEPE